MLPRWVSGTQAASLSLPDPHLASAWISLGIPDQGWELKGEAVGKKNVKNNCSLLCLRRRRRDTWSLVCEQSGEQEGSADRCI